MNNSKESVRIKAVFGGGEYELVEEFKNQEVSHSMWIHKIRFSAEE